nr:MAG TPA: hypothetical protein [Bacteriophage sp.]
MLTLSEILIFSYFNCITFHTTAYYCTIYRT